MTLPLPNRREQSTKPGLLGAEVKRTAVLGFPLALGELGWMSTYIVDAMMVGRMPHSALSISASSLGNTIYYAIVFCAIRFLTGLETLAAQAYGRGTPEGKQEAMHLFAQSLWFVVVGTPLVMLLTLGCVPLVRRPAATCMRWCGRPRRCCFIWRCGVTCSR